MQQVSFFKRLFHTFLGYLYWFTYITDNRTLLGMRYSTLIKIGAGALALAALVYDWGRPATYLALALLLSLLLAYWLAGRAAYHRFVPHPAELKTDDEPGPLAPYERVPVIASGLFSLQYWEKNVLLRPAVYWQAPRGDHAVMVEHQPRRYLYQFFRASMVEEVRRGWLIHGSHPRPAMAIQFLSIWGPEHAETQYSIFGAEPKPAKPIARSIILSFESEEAQRLVCHNIVRSVQQARQASPIDKP